MGKTLIIEISDELYQESMKFLNQKKISFNEWIVGLMKQSLQPNKLSPVESSLNIGGRVFEPSTLPSDELIN